MNSWLLWGKGMIGTLGRSCIHDSWQAAYRLLTTWLPQSECGRKGSLVESTKIKLEDFWPNLQSGTPLLLLFKTYLVLLWFALLYFIDNAFILQVAPCIEQVSWLNFPPTFVHCVALCQILIIPAIFHTLSLLLYLSWWSVIFDDMFFDVTIIIVLGTMNHTHVRLWT